jgi:hypothetical protein
MTSISVQMPMLAEHGPIFWAAVFSLILALQASVILMRVSNRKLSLINRRHARINAHIESLAKASIASGFVDCLVSQLLREANNSTAELPNKGLTEADQAACLQRFLYQRALIRQKSPEAYRRLYHALIAYSVMVALRQDIRTERAELRRIMKNIIVLGQETSEWDGQLTVAHERSQAR